MRKVPLKGLQKISQPSTIPSVPLREREREISGIITEKEKNMSCGELLFFQYIQHQLTRNNGRKKNSFSLPYIQNLLTINNGRNKNLFIFHCFRYFGTKEKTVTQLFQAF